MFHYIDLSVTTLSEKINDKDDLFEKFLNNGIHVNHEISSIGFFRAITFNKENVVVGLSSGEDEDSQTGFLPSVPLD